MIMAIPTIRHSIAIAFLCDFFFIESFVKIGITNHITNPIIMDITFIFYNEIGEEALFVNSASSPK